MEIFYTTLGRMAFLFTFIAIGYLLAKIKAVPEGSEAVLSKLESYLFIPCLVLSSFAESFTVEKLTSTGGFFVFACVLTVVMVLLSIPLGKPFAKDDFTRKICTYGIAIANIGFMGNAVVEAVFPHLFVDYLIFCIPINVAIYMWGVPVLLIPSSNNSIKSRLKSFLNPMFICLFVGAVVGLTGLGKHIPAWANSVMSSAGSCMSPAAMLLTGMTVSKIDLKKTFAKLNIYALSFLRLIIIPLCFVGLMKIIPFGISETTYICALCALSMPLGLNMVVIPGAYGKDTTVAAGMAIISHLLSCITIPIVFAIAMSI
ncbi:MAG: AEC family transporter [Clostridia bacterium]|nr:AEC family transporter [Clostridia bacterium]